MIVKHIERLLLVFAWLAYNIRTIRSIGTNLHMFDGITTHDIIGDDVFFEIIDPDELGFTYRLRRAKDFGGSFNGSYKISEGLLVLTKPRNGCWPIENAADVYNNIALMVRGECSFVSKTINAERAGARVAIITETESMIESDYYIEMIHDSSSNDADIPALYLLGKDGRMIVNTLKKLHRNYAIINMPVNLTFTPPHLINHPRW